MAISTNAAEVQKLAVAQLASRKLDEKGLDAIVVNDISRQDIGFDVDANEVTILTASGNGNANGTIEVGRAAKARVAEAILDAVAALRT